MDPEPSDGLSQLEADLDAVTAEVRHAVAVYALYRQAAIDRLLLDRLGRSRAATAFELVRDALRDSCVLALMRVWDRPRDALSIPRLVKSLRKDVIFRELEGRLAVIRDQRDALRPGGSVGAGPAAELDGHIINCEMLLYEVESGQVREEHVVLKTLRHRRLAHHAVRLSQKPKPERPAVIGDERRLLTATTRIVSALHRTVRQSPIDFSTFTLNGQFTAASFWHSVSGERAEDMPEITRTIERVYARPASPRM